MPDPDETYVEVEGRTLKISNLDKVLYPRTGTTKGEVLSYYAHVAPVLLPLVADRAVTRIRWPHGTGDHQFFEKNAPSGAPSWLRIAKVPTSGSRGSSRHGDTLHFPVIDGVASLTYLANLASLELHVHQWRVGRNGQPRNPDRLVIDLDPGDGVGLGECAVVALLVRDRLAEDDLDCRAVTSGSKGIHLYADLPGTANPDEVRDRVHAVAEELQRAHPALLLSQMTKAKRSGKVFLDWSQNAGSKTTITPYSLRGRERPFVAAPRSWAEIEAGADDPLGLEQLTMSEVLERVADQGDLFTS